MIIIGFIFHICARLVFVDCYYVNVYTYMHILPRFNNLSMTDMTVYTVKTVKYIDTSLICNTVNIEVSHLYMYVGVYIRRRIYP